MNTYWKVSVAVWDTAYSFDRLFTYTSFESVCVGCRVAVPFGFNNSKRVGMVLEAEETSGELDASVKPVIFVMDKEPLLNDEQLQLVHWLKEMTFCTYSDAIRAILPAGMQVELCQKAEISPNIAEISLSDEEKSLLCFLQAAKSQRSFDRLLQAEGNADKQRIIDSLFEKKALQMTDYARQKVGNSGIKMIRLTGEYDALSKICRITPKQKKLIELLKEQPVLSEKEACYLCGITGSVVTSAVKSGIVERYTGDLFRDIPDIEKTRDASDIRLSDEQTPVFEKISEAVRSRTPHCFLLHGVTGSGKTSVFLKLIDETIRMGRQVIMLVPEIALTPQVVKEFCSLFGQQVTVIHSELSLGQRADAYKRIKNGDVKIVIGTRSAVFAPAENLGLIIVDEEGERAYKSDSSPRYHAIEVAKKRCRTNNCTLLLASATPSVESYYYAKKGVYTLLEMKKRYADMPLPEVSVVDMNEERLLGNDTEFSDELMIALKENLKAGEQSILLLNRRGYHTIISCCDCNKPVYCPNCSVPMTYHKVNNSLMCHYCGHTEEMTESCRFCGGTRMRKMGFGTQTLEESLEKALPEARILRMDADTTMSRYAYEEKFSAFARGEYDIMAGTQMIGKGLNFPNVTLVGVLSVDKALFAGDFRSYERTFSLITQVVGRGGRGDKKGRAVLQTFMPEHYVLRLAAMQNYEEFYREEITLRRALVFPPICDICVIGFVGVSENVTAAAAQYAAQCIEELVRQTGFEKPLRVLGPMPFSYGKISGKYRYRLILKCKNTKEYRDLVREILNAVYSRREFAKIHIYADMNGDIGV
ncbi:MAG: primosomal protein N' [Oscillospiraceae bacterium]|nr:primosomal protein N' [Oscillospiraceae bacterium]